MKRIVLTLLALASLATRVVADDIDAQIDRAVRQGAHGYTRQQMRNFIDMGAHYELRDNSRTNEKEFQPAVEAKPEWLYIQDSGTVRLTDANGEVHSFIYTEKRVLRRGGHPVKNNGRYVVQVKLVNGSWINL
jgi:hypothetical protein